MTRVLLIADTERVQRIFQAMAEQGELQLQTASTLALGEFEISSSPPDFTFVQSRISGFSGDILLCHLEKLLPKGAKLVLLAGDSEDAAQAKRHGRSSLDLSMTDQMLEQTVASLLTGAPLPSAAAEEAPEAAKPAAAKVKAEKPEPVLKPLPVERPTAQPEPEPAQPTPEEVSEELSGERSAEVPAVTARVARDFPPETFEEVMRRAAAQVPPLELGPLDVEDRIDIGRGAPGRDVEAEPAEETAATRDKGMKKTAAGDVYAGESVADALLRAEQVKRSRPYLIIVPVLLLIAIPLVSYLAGKSSAPGPEAPQVAKTAPENVPTPGPPAVQPVLPPVAPPEAKAPAAVAPAAPGAMAKPQAQPAIKPEAKPESKPKPATKPAAKRGLENLPPMLEGTRLDADYGKKHPGWVRYLGVRAEYKLFKENNLYRAMQVIPVAGGTISDDLFKRVLREFGGVDSYRVGSSANKGGYLVEQCTTEGNSALTIYRNKKNSRIKALVVYYR